MYLLSVPFERGVMQNVESSFVAQCKVDSVASAQSVYYVERILANGVVESRIAVRILKIYVATVIQQHANASGMLLINGDVESAATTVVHCVDRRTTR